MAYPTSAIADLDTHPHRPTVGGAVSRRQILSWSGALLVPGVGIARASAAAQPRRVKPTTEEVAGPYYPVSRLDDEDSDLTVVAFHTAPAQGQVVVLSGQVTDLRGKPVAGADIEIWQADAAGHYRHPADPTPGAPDPGFQGYARLRTDADGRYRIKTIKPGAYPVGPVTGWTRPPHIHFDIRGRASRLVTQMYFEGEPLNETDLLLQRAPNQETLVARLGSATGSIEPEALNATWSIVLLAG